MKAGSIVSVPIHIVRDVQKSQTFTLAVDAPSGWKAVSGTGSFSVASGTVASLRVEVQIPELSKEQLKDAKPETIVVHVSEGEHAIGDVKLKVQLVSGGVPQ